MKERKIISFNDNVSMVILEMSEGNKAATKVLMQMIEGDIMGIFSVLSLDDMNIRGAQIWVGYKDYCGGNLNLFLDAITKRDENMVKAINIETALMGGGFKSVCFGASFKTDRNNLILSQQEIENLSTQNKPVYSDGDENQMQ